MNRILVHDESINSYGFWVKTSGGDLSDFKKNPIMLYNHNRAWRGSNDDQLPIGIWNELKVEANGAITGVPEFDTDDQFAVTIQKKYEKKHLRAGSIGIQILAYSEAKEDLKPGQTRPTVTKWKLKEISIVDIPSNKNAVQLYDIDGKEINLSDTGEGDALPLLNLNHSKPQEEMDIKPLALLLKLSDDSDISKVTQAVISLQNENATLKASKTALEGEVKTLKDSATAELKKTGEAEITAALADGRLTESSAANFRKLMDADHESAMAMLKDLQPIKKLKDFAKGEKGTGEQLTHNGKTYEQLEKEDPKALQKLKDTDPAAFKELFESSSYFRK